jgi:predicted DsbA family dithiol-disulfide isomerase
MNLTVDVVSDGICPWCYIGKRRLERAIAALEGQHEIKVHWHPFQLNPTMPKEGISRKEYRVREFGSGRWNWMPKSLLLVSLGEFISPSTKLNERQTRLMSTGVSG